MSPLDLHQFLANAQEFTVPNPDGATRINQLFQEMLGVIDLTPQSHRVEWDSHRLTATVTATPQFSVPESAINATTVYHHIGVQREDSPTTRNWFVTVQYPGLSSAIEVLRAAVDETQVVDLLSADNAPAATRKAGFRQPLIVWPRGTLIIQRDGSILGGHSALCEYVRVIEGAPGTAQIQTDLTGGFV
ncbi:MAG: hypothetical protein ACE5LB_15250 [Acidiferrobacterales bacterium]